MERDGENTLLLPSSAEKKSVPPHHSQVAEEMLAILRDSNKELQELQEKQVKQLEDKCKQLEGLKRGLKINLEKGYVTD